MNQYQFVFSFGREGKNLLFHLWWNFLLTLGSFSTVENLENGMLLSKILGIVLSGSGSKNRGMNREKIGISVLVQHCPVSSSWSFQWETFCEVVALFSAAVLHLLEDMKVFWRQTMCKAQKNAELWKCTHTKKKSPNPHKTQTCLLIYWTVQKCFLYKKKPISQRLRKA